MKFINYMIYGKIKMKKINFFMDNIYNYQFNFFKI